MKEINKILLLGSGALKIGEAGEFDYSGSQAAIFHLYISLPASFTNSYISSLYNSHTPA